MAKKTNPNPASVPPLSVAKFKNPSLSLQEFGLTHVSTVNASVTWYEAIAGIVTSSFDPSNDNEFPSI